MMAPTASHEPPDVGEQTEPVLVALRQAALAVFSERGNVLLAYLYGSVARDQALPLSDIDVGLVLREELPFWETLDLEGDVERALAQATGFSNIEVHVVNRAPLLLLGAMVTEGALIYARDNKTRIGYEVTTRNLYFDYLPSARAMAQTFAESLPKRLAKLPRPTGRAWPE